MFAFNKLRLVQQSCGKYPRAEVNFKDEDLALVHSNRRVKHLMLDEKHEYDTMTSSRPRKLTFMNLEVHKRQAL